MPLYQFFLGGHDLEMLTIRSLLEEAGLGKAIHDAGLSWGAKASAYRADLERATASGDSPVLVELTDDLEPSFDRSRWLIVDHHNDRAGRDQPSSLRQVHDLLSQAGGEWAVPAWSRHHDLVAANDIAHVAGLRDLGATREEIVGIRDADRAAQGVMESDEAAARQALKTARKLGEHLIVETTSNRTSPVTDFLLPEYGAAPSDAASILVLTPETVNYFGPGQHVLRLHETFGGWYGGALPDAGFWGHDRAPDDIAEAVLGVLTGGD